MKQRHIVHQQSCSAQISGMKAPKSMLLKTNQTGLFYFMFILSYFLYKFLNQLLTFPTTKVFREKKYKNFEEKEREKKKL